MATYTENYNLKKPTYAEPANVKDINDNMEKIDDVMHSTQISLADAYDLNSTYNTGDKVMYELLMYKCKEDGVTGAWDASKWERTTAVEGSGGADLDIYGEASGTAEASFSDGAEASLVECEIGIVPTQDLHGYSKPWAGGANYNKWDEEWEVGYIDSQGNNTPSTNNIRSKNHTPIEPNTSYYLKSGYTTVVYCPIFFYDANKVFLSANLQQIWNTVITTPPNARYIRFYMNSAYGDVYNNDIGINYPSTETDYSPYANICPISGHTDVTVTVASTSGGSGDDTTVSLGRTVYGGTLDVTTGELIVTHGIVDLGTLNWIKQTDTSNYVVFTQASPVLSRAYNYNFICTQYATAQKTRQELLNGEIGTSNTALTNICIRDDSKEDMTEAQFKTAMNGVMLVYELATPQTYNLTPTQVKTLLGQNYVSHDGGGTISLVYIKKDSTIIPNPTGADIPLTGIEIDGEKFKIAGGNGGRTEDILFEKSYLTANPNTITLNHAFTDYDEIQFWTVKKDDSSYYDYLPVNIVPVEYLTDAMAGTMSGRTNVINISGWQPMSQYVRISVTSASELAVVVNNNNLLIRKIVGIKY